MDFTAAANERVRSCMGLMACDRSDRIAIKPTDLGTSVSDRLGSVCCLGSRSRLGGDLDELLGVLVFIVKKRINV